MSILCTGLATVSFFPSPQDQNLIFVRYASLSTAFQWQNQRNFCFDEKGWSAESPQGERHATKLATLAAEADSKSCATSQPPVAIGDPLLLSLARCIRRINHSWISSQSICPPLARGQKTRYLFHQTAYQGHIFQFSFLSTHVSSQHILRCLNPSSYHPISSDSIEPVSYP